MVDQVYVRLEELLVARDEMMCSERREEPEDAKTGQTKPEQPGDQYRAVTDSAYRGSMNPEFVTWSQEHVDQRRKSPAQSDGHMKENVPER